MNIGLFIVMKQKGEREEIFVTFEVKGSLLIAQHTLKGNVFLILNDIFVFVTGDLIQKKGRII
jgi:hypothetical protein